jgi:2-octaprenyl-6-methoxyphenol hydroxylase
VNAVALRVLVVGGGMGGVSLALLLARDHAIAVTLVEQAPLPREGLPDTPSYDARSTALSLGSAEILRDLGAWSALRVHAAAIGRIQVSQQGAFGTAQLSAQDEGVAALGFVVENRRLGQALLAVLHAAPVAVHAPATLEKCQRTGRCWQASFSDGGVGEFDLVVVADGAESALRAQFGIATGRHDYGATAVVCNATPLQDQQGLACERFTADGALALLPLTENRCAVVWSLPNARAREVLALDDAGFVAALSAAAGGRLGGFARAGVRAAYPLQKVVATEQARDGLVLVGNAAHLLHPVAGQGFNLTLRDAQALAACLRTALSRDEDAAALVVLQRYVDARAQDQALTAGLSHGLPLLFANDNALLAAARTAGLLAFDRLAPLKREFARQAMGIGIFTRGQTHAG